MREYASAADLPEGWDQGLHGNIYMRRWFLQFMEGASDNTNQRYGALQEDDGQMPARLVLFDRPDYPITQFTSFALRARTTFVHVPLSVSKPGLALEEAGKERAFAFIRRIRGMKLVMNLPEELTSAGFAQVRTCPRCVLDLRWNSFEAYLRSLRSGYRSRYKKALQRSAQLKLYLLPNNLDFSNTLYALYEQVHDKARYKVEKLRAEFFQGNFFKIFLLEAPDGKPVAFFQLLANGTELIFEFAGVDYAVAPQYDAYIRLLLEIVKYGVENGFKRIDFGQTAEDAKLKLGCRYEDIFVLAHHSNPLLNLLLRLCAPLLQYRPISQNAFNVFNGAPSKGET
jgi:hypothetical protein